ncbi:MAG: holo-ACP synthase [Candidatus Edwardsbacteria bacterium]
MAESIGVDLVEVQRIRQAIERWGDAFLHRIFTPTEIAFCESRKNKYESYAARFAAKEAVSKALGTGFRKGVYCRQIEIIDNEKSIPTVRLHGRAKELVAKGGIILSLSHTKEYSIAMVLIKKR